MGSEKKFKQMRCKQCNHIVDNVGENARSVTCSECTDKNVNKALYDQDNMKGGNSNMEEETKNVSKTQLFLDLTPKIIELNKAGKSAGEIRKELNNSIGVPKIKRIIAANTK